MSGREEIYPKKEKSRMDLLGPDYGRHGEFRGRAWTNGVIDGPWEGLVQEETGLLLGRHAFSRLAGLRQGVTEAEVIRALHHHPRPGVEAAAEMESTERHFKGQMTGLHSTWCQMEELE